jgi:enamine deaminase RidA (YjgF/YER057c/UK114 family)
MFETAMSSAASVASAEMPRSPTFINPPDLHDPRPNGYSHVVVAEAPARFIYVAGQGGEDGSGQLPADFAAQVQQALQNLITALTAADAILADVVKLTVLIVDHDETRLRVLTRAINAAWGERPAPACTLIPVPRLALDGMLLEIEATAVAPLQRVS